MTLIFMRLNDTVIMLTLKYQMNLKQISFSKSWRYRLPYMHVCDLPVNRVEVVKVETNYEAVHMPRWHPQIQFSM